MNQGLGSLPAKVISFVFVAMIAGCGGGAVTDGAASGSTSGGGTTTYTIGGAVSGLTGTGLVLQDNGGDNLTLAANGIFTFATKIVNGGTYNVTVLAQPIGQTCSVHSLWEQHHQRFRGLLDK